MISQRHLRDGETDRLVPAELYDCILPRHLDQHEQHWKPVIALHGPQHAHWNWRAKMDAYTEQLRYESFALECDGMVQGLMIVSTIDRCRIATQANLHLVYIEYLEAAPWNHTLGHAVPRYRGVGTTLVAAAIELSIEEGNAGRIGLHSLPQADSFYSRCGMTDLGPDEAYPNFPLRYFEMTDEQAASFLGRQ